MSTTPDDDAPMPTQRIEEGAGATGPSPRVTVSSTPADDAPMPPQRIEEGAAAESRPTKPLSAAAAVWYSLASLGCGAFYSFNNFVLPLLIRQMGGSARLMGYLGSTHSYEGVLIQPFVGALSDRCRSKYGRRRPFMIIFIPLTALFLVITPFASHLPKHMVLPAMVAGIVLFTVMFNVAADPYEALMPDITPEHQRGKVRAVWALFGVVGQAGILFLPLPLEAKFGAVAAVLLVTTVLTCINIKEEPLSAPPPVRRNRWNEFSTAILGLFTLRQAAKCLLVAFLFGTGVGLVLPYLTPFVKDMLHCSDGTAQLMPMILMIVTALTVMPFGWLADRYSARAVLIVGLSLVTFAMLNALWVSSLPHMIGIMVLAGIGNGAQSASTYPLMTQLIPKEEVGIYTGFQTAMLSISQPVLIWFVGGAMGSSGYQIVFAVCAVCMALGVLVCFTIRRRAAVREVALRREMLGLS